MEPADWPAEDGIISGNIFKFYIPATLAKHPTALTLPTLSHKVTTLPTPKSAPAGLPARLKPRAHIHAKYRVLAAGDGLFAALGGTDEHLISRWNLIGAALECGYGRRKNWSAPLVLSYSDSKQLVTHLLLRVELVLNCLEVSPSQAQVIKPFFERIESTEKGDVSFILGGLCTFLAARRWLRACGDPMQSFFHVGLCANALSTPMPYLEVGSTGTKSLPDYVAVSSSTKLHLFESKGSERESRWGSLMEGLDQLFMAPSLGWGAPLPNEVASLNCVHVTVDAGCALEVTVIDPPPDPMPQPQSEPPEPVAHLLPGVLRLMKAVEAIDLYRALTSEGDEVSVESPMFYEVRTSNWFGGIQVGVPTAFTSAEADLRRRLAAFLVVREVLDSKDFFGLSWEQQVHSLRAEVLVRLGADGMGQLRADEDEPLALDVESGDVDAVDEPEEIRPTALLESAIDAVRGANRPEDMLSMVSRQLELDRLAGDLYEAVDRAREQVQPQSNGFITTGGLWLTPREPAERRPS